MMQSGSSANPRTCPRPARSRVDPATNTIAFTSDVLTFNGFGFFNGLAATGDAVWVTAHSGLDDLGYSSVATLFRIDPETGATVATVEFDDTQAGRTLVADDDAVWLSGINGVVYRVDPSSNSVVATIDLQVQTSAIDLAVDDDAVYASTPYSIYRIDPATNRFDVLHGPPHELQLVPEIDLSGFPRIGGNLALADDALFVFSDTMVESVNIRRKTLHRIDTTTLSLDASFSLGDDPRTNANLTVVDDILRIEELCGPSFRIPLQALAAPVDE